LRFHNDSKSFLKDNLSTKQERWGEWREREREKDQEKTKY
jgi:hypothetical protein